MLCSCLYRLLHDSGLCSTDSVSKIPAFETKEIYCLEAEVTELDLHLQHFIYLKILVKACIYQYNKPTVPLLCVGEFAGHKLQPYTKVTAAEKLSA